MLRIDFKKQETSRLWSSRRLHGKKDQPNREIFRLWLVLLLALGLVGPAAFAQVQASGTISGHVTDVTGASVAKASVVITETQTGVTTSTTTSSSGFYSVTLLKPGVYSIQVTVPGFDASISSNLTLQVAQVLQQDFQLKVGDVKQQVTVSAGAPLLNTETTDLGNVIERAPIIQLPLNGRNFSQLALLVPGTNGGEVGGTRTTGNGNETARNGANIVADGARSSFNTYLIDGLNDNDQLIGTIKVFPNLEDVQEFKVQIGNYDAEYMSGGAVINVTTASGSNQLHGSAFEFLRNSALDTRQYFDAPNTIPPYIQNQFGASLGGPIRKDKMFFFADYQGLRIHESFSNILSEPTAALRGGDFSLYPDVIYDPTTYNATTKTRQPFPNNKIPQGELNPIAINLLATMPLPNLPGEVNNLRINPLEVDEQNQFDVRFDNVISSKDSWFARYTYGTADITYPENPVLVNGTLNPFAFAGSLRSNHDPSQQATGQEIHVFSPTLSNQLALGYTREYLHVAPLDTGNNTSALLGLIGSNSAGQGSGLASLGITGFSGYSASFQPEIVPQNTEEYSDTVSWVHGAHVSAFGVDVIHNDFSLVQPTQWNGDFSWTGNYTNNPAKSAGTGSGFADFMLGLPASSEKTTLNLGPPVLSYTEIGAFAQDTWRITQRLTITAGLRYDLFTNPVERQNRQSNFVPGPNGFTGIANGGSTVVLAGQNGVSGGIVNTQTTNFSPRIGLAYRLGEKTVVRGAYGLFYFDEQGTGSSARLFINYPDVTTNSVNCTSTVPCLNTSTGIPNTAGAGVLPQVTYMPIDDPTSNVQQWNLTLERQLFSNLVLRGSYAGSHGNALNIAYNPDTAYPGPGTVANNQPYTGYSSISGWAPIGISNYNGLQLSAEKRLSNGLYFLAAYTYSRSLDEGPGGNSSSSEQRINVQNPRNISAEYGLSDFNYSQRFTDSTIYQLPVGRGRKFLANAGGVTDALLGGWEANGILTLQTGAPFSVSMATSAANTGTFTRPNRLCNGNLPSSQRTLADWYDTSCFVSPPQYAFGNTGRNILIGPGLETLDFSLHKNFQITEALGLQFRVESFNMLNHPNFSTPGTSIGSTSAGTISSVITNAREIQIAARLHW
jgi:hypothetical protein